MPRLDTTVDQWVEAEFVRRAKQEVVGKRALLREIIHQYLLKPRKYPAVVPDASNCESEHLSVRLPMFLADVVRERAAYWGMSASRWKASLIQAHLMREPVLSEAQIQALRDSNLELRAIGRNLNQIARALNARPEETERVKLEVIEALADIINSHVATAVQLIRHSQNDWGID